MIRVIAIAASILASVPALAQSIHTIIPGMEVNPTVTFQCQFLVQARDIPPSEIVAKDATTGAILFELQAGKWLTSDRCITAPDGHSLDVLAPGPGAKFEMAPEGAKP
jgi:hypothetical protein